MKKCKNFLAQTSHFKAHYCIILIGLIVLYTLIFSINLVSSATWNKTYENGLLSYWSLDINGSDLKGDKHLEEIASPVHHNSGCKYGGCYNLTGTSYLTNTTASTGAINYPDGNLNSTISLWWKRNASTDNFFAFSYGINSALSDREIYVALNNVTRYVASGGTIAVTNHTWFDKNWHLITFLHYDNNTNSLYVDGNKYSSGDISTLTTKKGGIWIGSRADGLNWTGALDEIAIWNRVLNDNEIRDLYNDGNGIFMFDSISVNLNNPSNNSKTINKTANFSAILIPVNTSLKNATLYVWYANNNSLFNSTTNILNNETNSISTSFIQTFPVADSFIWNIYGCSNATTNCNWASGNFTLNISNFTENVIGFNNVTTEGATETFTLNITTSDSINSIYFIYNNTQYSSTINSLGGNNYTLKRILTIPNVSSNINNTFYWTLNLSSGLYNTTSYNQTVLNIAIDNCTTQTLKILNFTLVDEKLQTLITNLNSSVEIDLNIYPISSSISLINFSSTYTNISSGAVCLTAGTLNNTNYTMDVQIKYSADGYSPEYYHIQKYNLNNNTVGNNITLYDLLSAQNTDFTVTFKDSNYVPVSNALIVIKRKYVGEGVYKIVEVPMTDSYGSAVGHFDKNGIVYSIIAMKNGIVLGTFDNILIVCQDILTGECNINLNAPSSSQSFTDFSTYQNLFYQMTFNSSARKVSVSFITTDLSSALISLNLTKLDNRGNISVCFNSLTSSSGNFDCIVPTSYGNITIQATLYKDGVPITSNIYIIIPDSKDTFGYEGLIMVILLLLTIPLMLISSLVGIVLGVSIGLIIALVLNIYNGGSLFGTTSSLLWLLIAGGIIIWKLTHRNTGGSF